MKIIITIVITLFVVGICFNLTPAHDRIDCLKNGVNYIWEGFKELFPKQEHPQQAKEQVNEKQTLPGM